MIRLSGLAQELHRSLIIGERCSRKSRTKKRFSILNTFGLTFALFMLSSSRARGKALTVVGLTAFVAVVASYPVLHAVRGPKVRK